MEGSVWYVMVLWHDREYIGMEIVGNWYGMVWNGSELILEKDFCERFVLQRKLSKPLYLN